jgi:uncharacterized protein
MFGTSGKDSKSDGATSAPPQPIPSAPEYSLPLSLARLDAKKLATLGVKESGNGPLDILYYTGLCHVFGVPKDDKQAFNLFMQAAKENHAVAQCVVGEFYYTGRGVSTDSTQAFQWYLKAAEQSNAEAQATIGDFYRLGKVIPKDVQKAFEWYSKAAEQGNAYAQWKVGNYIRDGEVVPKDEKQAFEQYLLKAAEQGYANAQFSVAWCYEKGCGVSIDPKQAFQWYLRAAEQNDAIAQIYVLSCYERGYGVSKDLEQALKWELKLAEQDNSASQYQAGLKYRDGIGTTKDINLAIAWFQKAAQQGNLDAQAALQLLLPSQPSAPAYAAPLPLVQPGADSKVAAVQARSPEVIKEELLNLFATKLKLSRANLDTKIKNNDIAKEYLHPVEIACLRGLVKATDYAGLKNVLDVYCNGRNSLWNRVRMKCPTRKELAGIRAELTTQVAKISNLPASAPVAFVDHHDAKKVPFAVAAASAPLPSAPALSADQKIDRQAPPLAEFYDVKKESAVVPIVAVSVPSAPPPQAQVSVNADEKIKTKIDHEAKAAKTAIGKALQILNTNYEKLRDKLPDFKFSAFPDHFKCNISLALMTDPVITSDGQSYNRSHIEEWLQRNDTSPNTNELLSSKVLIPNMNLHGQILEEVEKRNREVVAELAEITTQENIAVVEDAKAVAEQQRAKVSAVALRERMEAPDNDHPAVAAAASRVPDQQQNVAASAVAAVPAKPVRQVVLA